MQTTAIFHQNSHVAQVSDALCKVDGKFTDYRYWWNKLHSIVNRCYSHACPRFNDYGGRGIRVYDGWYDTKTHSYDAIAFMVWCTSNGWKPGLQIDRIDNDGDYEPYNCRFVTAHENTRNRRNTHKVTICGVTHCLKDWCGIARRDYNGALSRVNNGIPAILSIVIQEGVRFHA